MRIRCRFRMGSATPGAHVGGWKTVRSVSARPDLWRMCWRCAAIIWRCVLSRWLACCVIVLVLAVFAVLYAGP